MPWVMTKITHGGSIAMLLEPRQLYRHMLDSGLDNLVVLPLNSYPNISTNHEV